MSDEIDQIAENLYESIGGSLCICQRTDVFHWCESCQRRCGLIAQALRDQYAKGRAEAEARIKELEAERDEWKRRAEDAEGRIGNALV